MMKPSPINFCGDCKHFVMLQPYPATCLMHTQKKHPLAVSCVYFKKYPFSSILDNHALAA